MMPWLVAMHGALARVDASERLADEAVAAQKALPVEAETPVRVPSTMRIQQRCPT